MSRLLAAMVVCGSLVAAGAPASAQIAAPPANADAVRADVARAYQDASRIVGLVSAVATDPRIGEAETIDQLVVMLDQKAGEIASAQAEITAISNRVQALREATSYETEAGRQTRRLLDDLGAFAGSASYFLRRIDEVRTAYHSTDILRSKRIRDNLGALNAGPIVSLEWAEVVHSARAAHFPLPSLGYALNGGLGCYYGGLAWMHRADAQLSTPSVASANVSGAAGCLGRMIDMGGQAQADPAARAAALEVLEAAAALLEKAAGDLRDAPAGTEILPRYTTERQSIQTRVNGLQAGGGAGQGE